MCPRRATIIITTMMVVIMMVAIMAAVGTTVADIIDKPISTEFRAEITQKKPSRELPGLGI